MKPSPHIQVEEKILVPRHMQDCYDYILDLTNIKEWNPGIIQVKKLSKGPPGLRSEYEVIFQLGLYKLPVICGVSLAEDKKRIVIRGEHKSFKFQDNFVFSYEGDLTGIQYTNKTELKGYWQKAAKLVSPLITHSIQRSVKRLEEALNGDQNFEPATTLERIADRLILPGIAKFTQFGYQWEHRAWVPSASILKHKIAVVTGANSDIGRATVLALARSGAKVIAIDDDLEKGEQLKQEVMEETGRELIFEGADLSDLDQTGNAVTRIYQQCEKLDILVNNAGQIYPKREETADGLEKTFASTLLSPFVLTESFYDLLKKGDKARIINVSSPSIYAQAINLSDLQSKEKPYNGMLAYARAKRGLVDLTDMWLSKWKEVGITVHSMHPGWTESSDQQGSLFYKVLKPILRTPEQGADTIIWLASSEAPLQKPGQFWLDRRPHSTSVLSRTETSFKEQKRLYETLHSYWERLNQAKTGT